MSDERTPDEGSGKPDPSDIRVDASRMNAAIRRAAGRLPVEAQGDHADPPKRVKIDAGAGGKGNDPSEDFNAALRRAAGFPPW